MMVHSDTEKSFTEIKRNYQTEEQWRLDRSRNLLNKICQVFANDQLLKEPESLEFLMQITREFKANVTWLFEQECDEEE